MDGSEATSGTGTGQTVSTGSLSHLPWNMIPSFRPGETEINEYAKKLEFLASLWPPEHLGQLSSRAAMLCEGSAFKKVMRIDAAKLKVNSVDGVKTLVQTLGGIWGRSNLEEKFERFERAIVPYFPQFNEVMNPMKVTWLGMIISLKSFCRWAWDFPKSVRMSSLEIQV